MEATDKFSNWEAHQHIAHRNDYRFLFELGPSKPLVEFLAQTEVPLGPLQELNRGTGIPIDTLKSWTRICGVIHRLYLIPSPRMCADQGTRK
jgi:hypothetical protein